MRREEVEYGFKTTVGSPLQQPAVRGAGPGAVLLSQNRKKEKMHLQYCTAWTFIAKTNNPSAASPACWCPRLWAFPGWCSRPGGWAQQPAFPPAGAPPMPLGRPRPPCERRLAECSLTNPRPLRSGRSLGLGTSTGWSFLGLWGLPRYSEGSRRPVQTGVCSCQ